ncbi:terminase small subunit [Microbacterium phage Barnstormer]|uniref:Terminase small subunit n=1 Tax=Microbacterium phage Barnstormer TaxID=3028491 RepID=A0AAF0CJS6_9CAUD|nr:terminase small subunit [Microbacterium phage Barnstormer]
MPGPVPQTTHQRDRDTRRRQAGTVTVHLDGELRGPEFPYDVIPHPHDATVAWWETWRKAPQAALFLETDWQTLKRAARLQDDVMTAPRASAAAVSELRLIEERLGATVVDRMRAKIAVSDAAPGLTAVNPVPSAPVSLADRRTARAARKPQTSTEEPAPF